MGIEFCNFNAPGYMEAKDSDDGLGSWYVVAFSKKFGDDLIVARFQHDEDPEGESYWKDQAKAIAEEFVMQMNRLTKEG